jgi:F0F1-type ATP synthase alpha subunit
VRRFYWYRFKLETSNVGAVLMGTGRKIKQGSTVQEQQEKLLKFL